MPTYTFSCCTTFDRRVGFGVSHSECPSCGKEAQRESVYRVNSIGWARTPNDQVDFSRDYKAYEEAAQEITYKSDRAGVDPPPFAKMAKAKALDLKRKGATVDDL